MRINAVIALSIPAERHYYGDVYSHVYATLIGALKGTEKVTEFSEFKYRDTLRQQVCSVARGKGGGGGVGTDFKCRGWSKYFVGFEIVDSGIIWGRKIWQGFFCVCVCGPGLVPTYPGRVILRLKYNPFWNLVRLFGPGFFWGLIFPPFDHPRHLESGVPPPPLPGILGLVPNLFAWFTVALTCGPLEFTISVVKPSLAAQRAKQM